MTSRVTTKRLCAAAAVLMPILAGCSSSPTIKSLEIAEAWARPTPVTATTAAVYMKVSSPVDDELVSIETPIAESAMVHVSSAGTQSGGGHHGGTTHITMKDSELKMSSNSTAFLSPGGMHIMLEGLRTPLQEGDVFELHMTFRVGGTVTTPVLVALNGL